MEPRLIINSTPNQIVVRIDREDTEERARLKDLGYQWLPTMKAWQKAWRAGDGESREHLEAKLRRARTGLITNRDYRLLLNGHGELRLVDGPTVRVASPVENRLGEPGGSFDSKRGHWHWDGTCGQYDLFTVTLAGAE